MTPKRHHYIFPDGRQEWHTGLRIHCAICTCDRDNTQLGVNHPQYKNRPRVSQELLIITEMRTPVIPGNS